jgi:hypothetical protein
MKNLIQIVTAFSATLLWSCQTTCKILPPPTVTGTNKEITAKAAADALPAKIAKAEVSGSYKNVVNETFVAVNQDDVAFYLLLQAYECESSHGRKQQADALLQVAREELARRHGGSTAAVASHPATLTPTEKQTFKKSPLKEEIATKLNTLKSM